MALIIQGAASRLSHTSLLSYFKLWNWRSLWNIVEVTKQELNIGFRVYPVIFLIFAVFSCLVYSGIYRHGRGHSRNEICLVQAELVMYPSVVKNGR